MNSCCAPIASDADDVGVPAERLSHPKLDALAQQPKAERAPNSAVVRPQAAGKSRSASSEWISGFVCRGVRESLVAAVASANAKPGQNSTGMVRHFTLHCVAMMSLEHKECWFEPTLRGWCLAFLVQDRLRASDVLHRDWDWSAWL